MLIGGELVEAASGRRFDNVNPATEEVLGEVADADAQDMRRAIEAARNAFDNSDWSTNGELRKRCLLQLHEAIASEREELRAELVAEVGCPLSTTYGAQLDIPTGEHMLWFADVIDTFAWERELPLGTAFGSRSWRSVTKEPVGVVGAIVPWNFPIEVTLSKILPALAMGNALILKPAPDTPWNATRLGRLVAENTDVPAGIFNVVPSSDHAVGEELVIDRRVDMISFTGSTATGRRIMERAAPGIKRLFLELGGKSAHVVLDDADFASVIPMAAAGACYHGGQVCALNSRLLVPRDRYEEAVELAALGMRAVPYGDPNDMNMIQGPQISSKQRDRVLGYIEQGVKEGARLVVGGGRPADHPKGWYVEPTLFADVTPSMTIAQEEIFGPVLTVIPFEDDADAVRIANATEYGLAGAVTSASQERARAVARGIRTGTISINGGMFYGPDAPFGGYKASGVGRMNGLEGLGEYLETKMLAGPSPET